MMDKITKIFHKKKKKSPTVAPTPNTQQAASPAPPAQPAQPTALPAATQPPAPVTAAPTSLATTASQVPTAPAAQSTPAKPAEPPKPGEINYTKYSTSITCKCNGNINYSVCDIGRNKGKTWWFLIFLGPPKTRSCLKLYQENSIIAFCTIFRSDLAGAYGYTTAINFYKPKDEAIVESLCYYYCER